MWDDLTLVANFVLSLMADIGHLVLNSILVFSVGLFILSMAIKFFKRII